MSRAVALPPATEKQVERAGDELMTMLGFTTWRLSQPRATKQSPGWPDRLYTHSAKGLALFWEAKRPGAKQRPAQRVFQAEVTACGIPYVCGTVDALLAWCVRRGLVTSHSAGRAPRRVG